MATRRELSEDHRPRPGLPAFDEDFQQGAVQLVTQTGKPIARVAWELGVNEGTLGNWCAKRRRAGHGGQAPLSEFERAELDRLLEGDRRAADAA